MSMILDAFVGMFLERLESFIEEKVAMMLGVKKDLKWIQGLIINIQNVLEDAERRRIEEAAINNWVRELRDVMYDADDIIDLCLIKGSQLLLDEKPSSSSNSGYNFSFLARFLSAPHRYEMGERISSLKGRLEDIRNKRLQINFDHRNPKTDLTKVSRKTSPTKAEFEVVGKEIEDATKDLIELMTGGEVRKSAVFAITGMGGIGKTTLADKVFNHRKVQTKFRIKVWVCVSQNYNEIELLKQVIRGAEPEAGYGDANTRAELAPLLRSAVTGKSIFLVLDDVWRADVWIDLLRSPLHTAHIDSSILITTRDENVAKQMGSAYIHSVNLLPVETGWEMLSRSLVMIGGAEEEIDNLREIGIQIIEKCHGLPLAIKAMAGVLSSKEPVVTEWKKILNNTAWSMTKLPEEISGALYLSYADLPSPLKQCFLYCSLYPEDCIIARDEIIKLWVAEGFIKEEGEGDSLIEDTAEEYYRELIRRNLLQPYCTVNAGGTVLKFVHMGAFRCKMHDLFRALALFISRDEIFSGDVTEKSATPLPLTKLRRVALTWGGNVAGFLGAKMELKWLRTLFNCGKPTLDFKVLVRFLHLRVLNLKENDIECIPDSIANLVHLRYLNLNRTLIRRLPESIGRLSNLQFLSLCECKDLKILPQSITRLQKLRCLALYGTPLSFIPKGIERLKQLNEFEGFVVGDDSASNEEEHSALKELSSLSNLRYIQINNLERARSASSVLLQLSQLKELHLSFNPPSLSDEQKNNPKMKILSIEKLFEELVPPKSVESFIINNYVGHSYPKWMMTLSLGSYLPYLSSLGFWGNISTPRLPPLGLLPNLRFLCIAHSDAVKRIGPEFFGGGVAAARFEHKIAFPMLQTLLIFCMKNLEEWFFSNEEEEEEDKNGDSQKLALFPRLNELRIGDCRKLRSLPSGLGRTGLKTLHIKRADSLKEVENLARIEWVELDGNASLERISNLPLLKCLIVRECDALKYVEGLYELEQLNLYQESMDCLPEWLLGLIEEQVREKEAQADEDDFLLQLFCNEGMLRRCQRGGEDWAFVQQIPRLNAYANKGGGYLRFVKQPFFYETNIGAI